MSLKTKLTRKCTKMVWVYFLNTPLSNHCLQTYRVAEKTFPIQSHISTLKCGFKCMRPVEEGD